MPEPDRTPGGHRSYDECHGRRLTFILRARELGFSLEQVPQLLRLAVESGEPCAAVIEIASGHLANVRQKIADLSRLESILASSVARCAESRDEATCPVLEMLST